MIPARQRKPLMEAIEHWKEIERGEGVDIGSATCSLCMEFLDADCKGCPVYRHTGKESCGGTPYKLWINEQFSLSRAFHDAEFVADTPALQSLARAEREFLESLMKG